MLERDYQAYLINKLKRMFLGCIIQKGDSMALQGIPDLVILFKGKYAMLEVKASEKSKERPNQRYYVEKWSEDTFCSFIYPENEEEVLRALQQSLGS